MKTIAIYDDKRTPDPKYGIEIGRESYMVDGTPYSTEFIKGIYEFWRRRMMEDNIIVVLDDPHTDLFPDKAADYKPTEAEREERRTFLLDNMAAQWEDFDRAREDLAEGMRPLSVMIKDAIGEALNPTDER